MTYKFKVISNSYCIQCLELSETEINLILERLSITINSPSVNKLLYLQIGLRRRSVQEAVALLVEVLFADKISEELKSYYTFKIPTNVEELFEREIYQRELLIINNLVTTVFDLPQKIFQVYDIDFFLTGELSVNPVNVLKILAESAVESSKLRNWYKTSFEENFASNLILDLISYSGISHRVLINSYWLKKEDLISNTGTNE